MYGFNVPVTFQDILAHLPKLKPEELEQVRLRLAALQKLDGNPQAPKLEGGDWLLEGLLQELKGRGLFLKGSSLPPKVLKEDYVPRAKVIRDWLLKGLPKDLRFIEKVAVARAAVDSLVSYLKRRKIPLSVNSVLVNLEKIPSALEEDYPGYWGAGMLRWFAGRSAVK